MNSGTFSLDNLLSQTFHNRGLANPSLAQKNRVGLGAAAKDLDEPFDLVLAADDRVQSLPGGRSRSDRGQKLSEQVC